MQKVEWESALPYEERQELASLFECMGDTVTLSSVGLLIWEEIQRPSALVPYLSRLAIDDLQKIRSIEECKPLPYIQRVAKDSVQLENAKHEVFGNDLFWLKPGQHTRDRYLVSVEEWRLLVWRMTDHKEYDDLLNKNRTTDVAKRICEDRRSKYEPFFRLDIHEN